MLAATNAILESIWPLVGNSLNISNAQNEVQAGMIAIVKAKRARLIRR
ncbi:MAG: hypothetical protein Q8N85_06185 [Candidatus Omnitrophota bacterium]|nr:hypothetical protein [Candidatus Omnitrophota bacterium]